MLQACEAGEVFALLEGGWAGWKETSEALAGLYASVREPWLARALLAYSARTGSTRGTELLARAPEPHSRYLMDALAEQLRGDGQSRRAALAVLAPLVARRPAWLPRLPQHSLPRDLLRAARVEREPLPLLHALLALAALVSAAPALAAPHWPELADALLRPAAFDPPLAPALRAHLQLAQLALFHALYATHPCTLIETLRSELSAAGARAAWERDLQPLLHSVRLHPALVTGSRAREADAARRLEEHEVVAETRRLTVHTPERRALEEPPPVEDARPPATPVSRAVAALHPGAEPWFALSDRCDADSAPHTPLPAEPPEAAVEATPENTPAKEVRAAFRFPSESGAVRAIGRSVAPSPGPESGRLARVLAERRAVESPVLFGGGAPPAGALRVEPRLPSVEDREVVELTARVSAPLPTEWGEDPPPTELAARLDPRRSPPRARTRTAPPPRRPASTPPAPPGRAQAVQTVDTWPQPYEFLIADFYRNLPDDSQKQEESGDPTQPCERLDAYLQQLYIGSARPPASELAEQLSLAHAQLMYERWRREAHAERNRRLLGRCRQTRAAELQNAALRDRLRAVTHECEQLRARLAARAGGGDAGGEADAVARLEVALQQERAARVAAEARLHEAEAGRLEAAAELQRSRGAAFEGARQAEALDRAVQLAERRAEQVNRLRRELLVLAEREARLKAEASRTPPQPNTAPLEKALRAAGARAEAEAVAANARADAAIARAHDLELTLANRDATLTELKRAARLAAEESTAKLQALQQRYDTLLRVLRAAEGRKLERLAGLPLGPRVIPPPPQDDEEDTSVSGNS